MSWKVIFTKRGEKDLKSLPNPDSALIPLKGKLKGIYKFRVGAYRILCEKRSQTLVIIVVKIGYRKDIYCK
jgi:mRNA interferase RelE/StbE